MQKNLWSFELEKRSWSKDLKKFRPLGPRNFSLVIIMLFAGFIVYSRIYPIWMISNIFIFIQHIAISQPWWWTERSVRGGVLLQGDGKNIVSLFEWGFWQCEPVWVSDMTTTTVKMINDQVPRQVWVRFLTTRKTTMKMKKCLVEKSRCILNTSHMVHIRPVDLQHPKPRMVIILMIRLVYSWNCHSYFYSFPMVICSHVALLLIFFIIFRL